MKNTVNIALPKGRLGERVYSVLESIGYGCPGLLEGKRKLIFESEDSRVCYFWAKPSDVAIYVERGAADIGIVGKDILLEYSPDVYELCDLGIGRCRMAVAGIKDTRLPTDRMIKVATKFPTVASSYFSKTSRSIDIINLHGSIEIAPLIGLSDVIVDIVETGETLRANNLVVFEDIVDISARLIVNKSSYRFKSDTISDIASKMSAYITENEK